VHHRKRSQITFSSSTLPRSPSMLNFPIASTIAQHPLNSLCSDAPPYPLTSDLPEPRLTPTIQPSGIQSHGLIPGFFACFATPCSMDPDKCEPARNDLKN